jgi:cytoskeletal protein CcmA (bactofilin family)
MSYREVESTCVTDISRYEVVPSDNPPSEITATARLFDQWTQEVKPLLEKGCAWIQADRPREQGFTFDGTLRIDGHVKGVLPSGPGTLIVGKSGRCDADASVRVALIKGVVNGNLRASELIEIESEARVTGNIEAPSISIEPGAVFEGNCHMRPRDVETNPDIVDDHELAWVRFFCDSEGELAVTAAS